MDSLHFKLRKNAPMVRQKFLAKKSSAGETVNKFITRLQKLAEHCDYEGERDKQVRDCAISSMKDRNLKAKLYREETLTLNNLILVPESQINHITTDSRQGGKCWRYDKVGHYANECLRSRDHKCGKCGNFGHFEQCCETKQSKANLLEVPMENQDM